MKTIKDFKHVAGTTAKALIFEGKPAGRIIANWSDNPSGTVCTASVIIWAGPLAYSNFNYANIGKAGGYGYDKLSSAVTQCFHNANVQPVAVSSGNGRTDDEFTERGYIIFDIC